MGETKQYDAFLSYNSADKKAVENIAERLSQEAKLQPFLDKWHLIPGEPWQEKLEEALDQSCTCAVFLGPTGLGPWEHQEMRVALSKRVHSPDFRVIPVLLPGTKMPEESNLPHFLSQLTWVDFRQGLENKEAFHQLICGIKGISPKPVQSQNKPTLFIWNLPYRQNFYFTGRRYFAVAALSTLLMASFYPLALLFQFDTGTAWYYFKNNPNYSFFVLGILPLAIGLFVSVAARLPWRRMPGFWKNYIFAGGLLILFTVVLYDALDKGPPIQPTHLAMNVLQKQAILTLEKEIRSAYLEGRNQDSEAMRRKYVQGAARILKVNESEIFRFSDVRDFLRRASAVAFVDLFISMVGAASVIIVFGTLTFVMSRRIEMQKQYGEAFSWICGLFVLWLPFRLYSLWHQNYYSLTSKGELFVFVLIVACGGLLLLIYLWSKGTVARAVQYLIILVSVGLGILLFFESNAFLRMIGEGTEEMSWRLFLSSEIVLIALLISAIWPYLDGE